VWHRAKYRQDVNDSEKASLKENMIQSRERFKEIAANAKKEKWEEFASTVAADKALGKFWRLHRQMNGRGEKITKNIKDCDGQSLIEDADKGQAFLKRFLQQSDRGNSELRKQAKTVADEICPACEYPDPLSVDEVKSVIKSSKESAGGPDGVRYSHLKTLSDEDLEEITAEMNKSVQTGVIPDDWLHSYLAPIPKPGKDHSALNGYRVITMQNVFGKVLEKVIAKRLSRELERKNLLPDGLGSYRPGRDTTINASVMAYDIYEGFQAKEETVIAAIDLEDAYNGVDYEKLIYKMVDLDLDPFMANKKGSVEMWNMDV